MRAGSYAHWDERRRPTVRPGAEEETTMGVRKSQGKGKKSKRPTAAIAAKREETLRRAAKPTRCR